MKPIWVPSSSSCAQNTSTDLGRGLTPSSSLLLATTSPEPSVISTPAWKSPLTSGGSGNFTSCVSLAPWGFRSSCSATDLLCHFFSVGSKQIAPHRHLAPWGISGIGKGEFHRGFGPRQGTGVVSIKLNGRPRQRARDEIADSLRYSTSSRLG